jgi:menaquinone-dependent protoporphyrinogen oxidase
MSRVLVAYATKHGSSREVAEAIGAAIQARGADVQVIPAAQVRDPLAGWDLVVLGAPLYSGRWHRDAHRFLKRHRGELVRVPVAVYGMGPRDDEPEAWRRVRTQLDRALAKREWLAPAAVTVFGGVDPPKRRATTRRDLRDWDAIRGWATAVADLAGPAAT